MCTLTFYPIHNEGFIITSNRDESRFRKGASLPQLRYFGKNKMLTPVDGEAGGSWIAAADNGRAACLLNGAFGRHVSEPPYRKSRGLIVLESFDWEPEAFLDNYNLTDIEPFTLVFFQKKQNRVLINELRWDGKRKYAKDIDATMPYIWSAAQLYPPEVIEQSEHNFYKYLQEIENIDQKALLDFNEQEKYRQKLERYGFEPIDILKTLAIVSITINEELLLQYQDLQNSLHAQFQMPLSL